MFSTRSWIQLVKKLATENHFTNKAYEVENSPSVSICTANSTEFKFLLGRPKDQFSFQEMVSQIYRHDFPREILWSDMVVSILCSIKPLINFTPCCISIIKSVERSPISSPIDLKRFYLGLSLFSQYISCPLISYVFKPGPFRPPSEPMTKALIECIRIFGSAHVILESNHTIKR
jgi:hypothetical protein